MLMLPFANTYKNAFLSMCKAPVHPHVAPTGRLCLYLKGVAWNEELPPEVTEWVERISHPVAMKDMLALSFALDYERRAGDPAQPQTTVGQLRSVAKPYGNAAATEDTIKAASQLVELCAAFLDKMTCYRTADSVVAMPPSDPDRSYNLPRDLASQIAPKRGIEDLSGHIRTVRRRDSIKSVTLVRKLDTLLGTVGVDRGIYNGRSVLLIDDLYQSGISMNYSAYLLLQTGAKKVFGLACEKTCRNDDNVPRRDVDHGG
jgi:predicted amidophosphoribosyltransferase